MRSLFFLVITFVFISCSPEEKETPLTKDTAKVKVAVEAKVESKKLERTGRMRPPFAVQTVAVSILDLA